MDTLKSGQPPYNGQTVHPLPSNCPYISNSKEGTTSKQYMDKMIVPNMSIIIQSFHCICMMHFPFFCPLTHSPQCLHCICMMHFLTPPHSLSTVPPLYMYDAFSYSPSLTLHSASIVKYLLEKSRIISQAPGERNYHVFYYLLAGADAQLKRSLNLLDINEYHYLTQVF